MVAARPSRHECLGDNARIRRHNRGARYRGRPGAGRPDRLGDHRPGLHQLGAHGRGQFWGIHGTEVASLIAGHGHGPGQANGIIGIAPAAKILSVRVTLESNDPMLSDQTIAAGLPNAIARGIRWAVRHDASVIDLPLDPVTTSGAPGSGGSSAERAAIDYAIAKKVILVAPAGDGGAGTDPVNYPAAYPGVIAVGAFDRHFVKAPFTSHQSYVLVTAAGAGVAAASPSGNYPQLNSTSAASAMVAGIVALIRAQFPTLTPAQITHAITASTVYHPPGGRANGSGFGTVDAAKALTAAAGIAERVSKSATSGTAGQAPPRQPAVHSSPIHRNIRGTLIKDAAIAGMVFLLLLGLIFAITAWRRRNARAARLAEVRAAVQPPVRRPAGAKSAARGSAKKGFPAGSQAGISGPDAEAAEPQLELAGFIAAPLGPAAGGPDIRLHRLRIIGFHRFRVTGLTGSAAGFTGSAAGFTGSGFSGSAAGFTGSASGFTGSASSGFAAPGPTSPGPRGVAALGAAGISPPGGIKPPAAPGPSAGMRAVRPRRASAPPALGPASGTRPFGSSVLQKVRPVGGTRLVGGARLFRGARPSRGVRPAGRAWPRARRFVDRRSPAGVRRAWPVCAAARRRRNPRMPRVGADLAGPRCSGPGRGQCSGPGGGQRGDPRERVPGCSRTRPASEPASGSEPAPAARADPDEQPAHPGTASAADTAGIRPAPPWEPAAEPNSELPWAQGPAPSRSAAAPLPRREQVRPNCLPGRNWRRTHGRAVPRRRVLIHRFRRPPGRTAGRVVRAGALPRVPQRAGWCPPPGWCRPRRIRPNSPGGGRRTGPATRGTPGQGWNRSVRPSPSPAPLPSAAPSGWRRSAGRRRTCWRGPSGVSLPGTAVARASRREPGGRQPAGCFAGQKAKSRAAQAARQFHGAPGGGRCRRCGQHRLFFEKKVN